MREPTLKTLAVAQTKVYTPDMPASERSTTFLDSDAVYREMARWGWNTEKLAKVVGISRTTLSKALNGHRVYKTTVNRIGLALRLEDVQAKKEVAP